MERRFHLLLLALTVALGAYLRLVDLGGPSLWHDEIIHLEVAEQLASHPWYRSLTGVREVAGYTRMGRSTTGCSSWVSDWRRERPERGCFRLFSEFWLFR